MNKCPCLSLLYHLPFSSLGSSIIFIPLWIWMDSRWEDRAATSRALAHFAVSCPFLTLAYKVLGKLEMIHAHGKVVKPREGARIAKRWDPNLVCMSTHTSLVLPSFVLFSLLAPPSPTPSRLYHSLQSNEGLVWRWRSPDYTHIYMCTYQRENAYDHIKAICFHIYTF